MIKFRGDYLRLITIICSHTLHPDLTNILNLMWCGKSLYKSFITRNMKTNRSCIPPQHAGTSWWSTENFRVHWLTILIFCFTVSILWYRQIQRRMACTLVLSIPAYIKSVAWLFVFMYAHVYMDTYMHARICIFLTVTDFMSTLWHYLPFIIYMSLQVSVRII